MPKTQLRPPIPNKTAWITGASKGIGLAVALRLAKDGWQVAISARNRDELSDAVDQAAGLSGRLYPYPLDITDQNAARSTVEQIETEIGPLDWVVLNAGTYIRFGVDEFTAEAFNRQVDINLNGTANCLDPVMKRMVARGKGRIGVVSSVSGYMGLPFASAYGTSKAALINMCESLRPELEAKGVLLSVINPGFVRTPLTDKNEFPMPFLMEVDEASRRIVSGLQDRRFEIAFPTRFVLILKTLRLLPYALYFKITGKML